jgi:hypothetical protein
MMKMTDVDALYGEVSRERMMRDLEVFAQRVKLSGTPEELESFRYLEAEMNKAGFRTRLIQHDAYISLPGRAALATEDGNEQFTCITHSFGRPSPVGGLVATAIDIGTPTQENFDRQDLSGRIAIIDGLCSPTTAYRARLAGAVGQIHVMPYEHLHEMCISNIWGSPEPDELNELPATVALTVSAADGARIRALIAAGDLRLRMEAEVSTGWGKTPILEAHLEAPGADADTPFILFSGHHDTWFEGVMDNGGANATMLEVGRIMAAHRDQLKRDLRLCFWSGHSHGRYSGSSWYADTHWRELSKRCLVHVNVDSTGATGNLVLEDMAVAEELRALAAEAIHAVSGQKLRGERLSRAGDQSFWGIGVPSMFIAVGEQEASLGLPNVVGAFMGGPGQRRGAGFGWWWHTSGDTLDKIDPEILERDTRLYAHVLFRLLSDAVPPLDYSVWARALSAVLKPLAASASAFALPVDDALAALDGLETAAATFNPAALPPAVAETVLRDVSRSLVPVDYTYGDRFHPDPALPAPDYPLLEPVRALVAAGNAGKETRHHLVAARRSMNQLAEALEAAADILSAARSQKEMTV